MDLTGIISNTLTNGLGNNLVNNISSSLSKSNDLSNQQNSFLQSNLWKTINSGLDIGIRALLPNFLEDAVIGIKDALVNNGLQGGIQKAVEMAKDITGSGIITGAYKTITEAYNSLKNGNLIGNVGDAITNSITNANRNKEITAEVSTILTNGTKTIMDSIEANIKESFNDQLNLLEKLNKCNNNWRECFENRDFAGMEKEYKKIENAIKKVMPTENTIKQARIIENLHTLIKNNNKNFDVSDEQIELAKKLA